MGGTPHGGDPQWGELPIGGIPFFWKSEFTETTCFFYVFARSYLFCCYFEFSREWHILKFDSAFDTLYGRP